MRGGVPVLKRISSMPCRRRLSDSPSDGSIPSGPELYAVSPTTTRPFRYVPVAIIIFSASHSAPREVLRPWTFPSFTSISVTSACTRRRFTVFSTTYALILPAITIDKDSAIDEPGLDVYNTEGDGKLVLSDSVSGDLTDLVSRYGSCSDLSVGAALTDGVFDEGVQMGVTPISD